MKRTDINTLTHKLRTRDWEPRTWYDGPRGVWYGFYHEATDRTLWVLFTPERGEVLGVRKQAVMEAI